MKKKRPPITDRFLAWLIDSDRYEGAPSVHIPPPKTRPERQFHIPPPKTRPERQFRITPPATIAFAEALATIKIIKHAAKYTRLETREEIDAFVETIATKANECDLILHELGVQIARLQVGMKEETAHYEVRTKGPIHEAH